MTFAQAVEKLAAYVLDLDTNGLVAYDKYPVNEMETAYAVVAAETGIPQTWLDEYAFAANDTVASLQDAYATSKQDSEEAYGYNYFADDIAFDSWRESR